MKQIKPCIKPKIRGETGWKDLSNAYYYLCAYI